MITIFTDGSSRGNPGPGGWGAIIVSDDTGTSMSGSNVTELGGREDHTTNNRMELTGAIRALRHVVQLSEKFGEQTVERSIVNTDSSYVINGITKWVHGWIKKNWITSQKEEVMNRDLWQELVAAVSAVESVGGKGAKISWKYVGGHAGIPGNERCDEIATSFADKNPVKLFSGPIAEYPIRDILNLSASAAKSVSKKSSSSKKAYSYVSMVGGAIETHATWTDCESRVKGTTGARYKKSFSPQDEAEIIRSFSSSNL